MRVIVRKQRPHPGAQLRHTDADGMRPTAFATRIRGGQLLGLELWYRRRAPVPWTASGSARKPAYRTCHCTVSLKTRSGAIVTLAAELTAWIQMLTFPGPQARRWGAELARLSHPNSRICNRPTTTTTET
jgi:hypothetical protein